MTIDSMNLKLNIKENINNYKILLCFIKNKLKIKLLKSQWLKFNILKLYKQKLLILKKWWLKSVNFKLKYQIKTDKFKH